MPVAPGTAGTLVGVLVYLLLVLLQTPLVIYFALCIALTILGCIAADLAGRHFGVIDAQQIVIDEIVGFLIAMFASQPNLKTVVVGFTLFRLLDIVKPWPASYFDRTARSGFDVVMDDVVAGVYTLCCLQVLVYFKIV